MNKEMNILSHFLMYLFIISPLRLFSTLGKSNPQNTRRYYIIVWGKNTDGKRRNKMATMNDQNMPFFRFLGLTF